MPKIAAEQPAPKVEERKVTPMDLVRFRGIEYMREHYLCTAHANTRPEDLLKPEYWAHVATLMRPRARIEAWADDGTWMAEYVVLEAGRNWARLFMLEKHFLTTADVAMTQADALSPYEIAHRGPHSKWSVIRKVDREVVHEGEETPDGAAAWTRERLKAE